MPDPTRPPFTADGMIGERPAGPPAGPRKAGTGRVGGGRGRVAGCVLGAGRAGGTGVGAVGAVLPGGGAGVAAFRGGEAGRPLRHYLLVALLFAGRALWFYAGKLLRPVELAVFYPLWDINAWSPPRRWWCRSCTTTAPRCAVCSCQRSRRMEADVGRRRTWPVFVGFFGLRLEAPPTRGRCQVSGYLSRAPR